MRASGLAIALCFFYVLAVYDLLMLGILVLSEKRFSLEQATPETVVLDGGVLHDERMKGRKNRPRYRCASIMPFQFEQA